MTPASTPKHGFKNAGRQKRHDALTPRFRAPPRREPRMSKTPKGSTGRDRTNFQESRITIMGFKVAVVGATGNVGREMMNILAEREFPADEVVALASRKSLGQEVSYGDKTLKDESARPLRFLRRRHLPDVGRRRGVEGMVAEDRRRRRGGDR